MLYYFMRNICEEEEVEEGGEGVMGGKCSFRVTSLFWVAAFLYLLVPCFHSSFLAYVVCSMFTSLLCSFVRSFIRLYIDISPYFIFDVFFVRDVIIVILIYIGLRSEMGSQTINIYVGAYRNLHTSESRDISGWCETAVTYSLCLTLNSVRIMVAICTTCCNIKKLLI